MRKVLSNLAARLGVMAALVCALLPLCAAEEPADKPDGKKLTRQLRPELLVPEAPFLYISTPDVKKARAAFERSAFMGLVNEEEVNAPILAAFGKLRETYVKGDGTRSEAELKRRNEEVDLLMKILPMLESHVAIALDLDAAGLAALSNGKIPRFLLIAAMPPGDLGGERQGQIEDTLDTYRNRMIIDAKYHDFDTARNSYAVHGIENAELGTYESWAFVENLMVYAQGKGLVEEAIDRYVTKKPGGALESSAGYQAAYKQVGRDEKGESLVYVQLNPAVINLEKMESGWMKIGLAALIGVTPDGKLPEAALGIQIAEGQNAAVREKLYVRMAPKEGTTRPVDGCKGESARFVPGDGLFYAASQGNFKDTYAQLKDNIAMNHGSASASTFDQRVQVAVGAKDPAELQKKLELFKGEFSYFVEFVPRNIKVASWGEVLENFQVVVCLELDRENVNLDSSIKELMAKLEQETKIPYVSTNAAGAIIRYQKGAAPGEDKPQKNLGLRANLDNITAKATPFFACWTRVDVDCEPGPIQRHFLLMADDLPSLRKAMSQRLSQRTSMFDEPKFKETLKTFRESRHHLSYLDMNKATTVYSQLIPMVSRAELIEREKLNRFPSAQALRPHLFPIVSADSYLPKNEGVLTEFSSPTGILPMAALVASVAWPEVNYQHQRAISDEVDQKFKQIMLGLQLYAADFDRFPPQLSDLVGQPPTAYIDVKKVNIFESPFNRGAIQSAIDVDNPEMSNLIYVPNRNLMDLGNDIILYEKQPTRVVQGETKLLYHAMTVDGKIRPFTKAGLERALAGKFSSTGKNPSTTGTTPSAPKKK